MKTPQISNYFNISGSDAADAAYPFRLTKADLARIAYGSKSFLIALDVVFSRLGVDTVVQRSFEAAAGGGAPYTDQFQTVIPRKIELSDPALGGSSNFSFKLWGNYSEQAVKVSSGLYAPFLAVAWNDSVVDGFYRELLIGPVKPAGYDAAPGVMATLNDVPADRPNGYAVSSYNATDYVISGAITITSTPWS